MPIAAWFDRITESCMLLRLKRLFAAIFLLACCPQPAFAGMPGFTLTDVARVRLQTISFFLIVFLASALAVQFLWNMLQKDFPRLPRLKFRHALAGASLWGLVFILVLTMISGARELMTPGAWEKVGLTYKLTNDKATVSEAVDQQSPAAADPLMERREKLDELRLALWNFAATHEGKFPDEAQKSELAEDFWRVPSGYEYRYQYFPDRQIAANGEDSIHILVAEPEVFSSGKRFVLFNDGRTELVSSDELALLFSVTDRTP